MCNYCVLFDSLKFRNIKEWLDIGGWISVVGYRWLDIGGWINVLAKRILIL